ncbi:alpha/beta hydrolase [Paenibacillus sp. SYP-B3998]|uniref:alpha/beta hydrolase n=1 Tax=Paenibacillus sp. SYP-B3998 TaxID=2678564 RepID=UPI0031F9D471
MALQTNVEAVNKVKDSTEVTIPGTEQRVMQSRVGNSDYRIFVYTPDEEPPVTGFPVIYLLDANAVFGTMVEAQRLQGRRPEKTGVVPAIVVGIGYQTEAPFASARYYDYTLPMPVSELPKRPDGTEWPEQGGAEAFLTFIEEELKPEIERDFPIDSNRQMIFGHSLGGLFVLHVLFTKPTAFQSYIAGSPSIHWNKRILLEEEQHFTLRMEQNSMDIGLLLTVGELESSHKSRMNDNAKELSERLSKLANQGLRVEFKQFEDEGHVSVLPVLISRALRFGWRSLSVNA